MRIIAGIARSVPLFTPKDDSVRPAMDSTRAAIFSSLGEAVLGASCLDLFAGTGSIGLEALSRGALSCVFVEKNKFVIKLLKRNLEKTKLEGTVLPADVLSALERLAGQGEKFDLIFADPPFTKKTDIKGNLLSNPEERHFAVELLQSPLLPTLLKPEGILILDSYHFDRFSVPDSWVISREKIYGQVRVQFLVLPKS